MSNTLKFRIVSRVTRIEEFRDTPARTRVAIALVNDDPKGEPAHMNLDLSVAQAVAFRNGGFVTITHESAESLDGRPHP